jgi:hypothetical protein
MLTIVRLIWSWLTTLLKSRERLEAENVVLRHQLNVLRRWAPQRMRLSELNRLAFVWLYRLRPAVLDAVTIVRPETVVRWHRMGFKAFCRWKSRSHGGQPSVLRANLHSA